MLCNCLLLRAPQCVVSIVERHIKEKALPGAMQKKRLVRENTLRSYFFLVLAIGILGLVDYGYTLWGVPNNIYVMAISSIYFLFLILNIVAIPLFLHRQYPVSTLILPIYEVIIYFLLPGLSLGITFLQLAWSGLWVGVFILGILSSFFEIGFSAYMLRRLKLW